ncbi:hypothetical protein GIB67_011796 [Kingdonia uniflora]|uniref:Uncharacterized protein n=1 Tax=Kingdonia uniflora TaxID=39325 RepID=A0A7J7NXL2_9MAGN|nr:hypothetical protein GIB67_011796 [Kingdonia uniflora]
MGSVMKVRDILKQTVSKHTSSIPKKAKRLSSGPIPNINTLLQQIKSPVFKLFVGGIIQSGQNKITNILSLKMELMEKTRCIEKSKSRANPISFPMGRKLSG